DQQGRLHLRLTSRNGLWYCPEVVSSEIPGYGSYRFYLDSPAGALDPNVVLGLFTWSVNPNSGHRELDAEFSKFGVASTTSNAQFVVQPYTTPGNLIRYLMPPSLASLITGWDWMKTT